MKSVSFILTTCLLPLLLNGQHIDLNHPATVTEIDNAMFKTDTFWRGADGGATVLLPNNKILWLFSDTFIDQDGTGRRSNSEHMVHNSRGIQNSDTISSDLEFYWKGSKEEPEDFFQLPGPNWFWTGHGISIEDKLLVFLSEETDFTSEMGFKAVGWHVAIIDNPTDNPNTWNINYVKGCETYGVIIGSSTVLVNQSYIYAFGVKEPDTHETYLVRFDKEKLVAGELSPMAWWIDNEWNNDVKHEPVSSPLFIGSTEFSVNYDGGINKFIQLQTFGFGNAQIGYRTAEKLQGPWSDPILLFTPKLKNSTEFSYSANSHPEFNIGNGIIVTCNVNNNNFQQLKEDETIYFPKILFTEI